jgi:hypothetical protein
MKALSAQVAAAGLSERVTLHPGFWEEGHVQLEVVGFECSELLSAFVRLREKTKGFAQARLGRIAHFSAPTNLSLARALASQGVQGEFSLPERDIHADIVVVGAGTSGVPAAIFAKTGENSVFLIENNGIPGGTATAGGVSSYWFGRRGRACELMDERVQVLHEQTGSPYMGMWWSRHDRWHNELKAQALTTLVKEKGVTISTNTLAFDAQLQDGKMVRVRCATDTQILNVTASLFMDATGDADLAALAGLETQYGGPHGETFWASLGQLTSPEGHQNNFTSSLRLDDPQDCRDFIMHNRRLGKDLYDHCGYIAPRESRHIRGRKTLTLKEELLGRRYGDAIHTCFSNYDPKGKSTDELIYCGFLPPNLDIEIPLGCLLPLGADNLAVVGKAFSCDHDAFPAVRMQADLMEIGRVCGLLAAWALTRGVAFTDIKDSDVSRVLGRDNREVEPADGDWNEIAEALEDNAPWQWIDMNVNQSMQDVANITALLLTSSEQVVPILKQHFHNSQGVRRESFARLLLWHGEALGAGPILTRIEKTMAQEDLPKRKGSISFCQIPPDHGVMPEVVNDLHLLSRVSDTRVIEATIGILSRLYERLRVTKRDYHDVRKGIFAYVETFAVWAVKHPREDLLEKVRLILEFEEFSHLSDPVLRDRMRMLQGILQGALELK